MHQLIVFSGDGLQTARGESHTLCCVRSGLLLEGYTSAYNYYPITNAIGSDKHEYLIPALEPHKETFQLIASNKKLKLRDTGELLKVLLYCTGDMAFGLSLYALNPAASTHGNPWLVRLDDGSIQWRTDESLYLLAHEVPPGHGELSKQNPIQCPSKYCNFKATCLEDIEADRNKVFKGDHVKQHCGKYPHKVPVLPISINNYIPPLYHCGENLIAYRFQHLIWKELTNELKYDVNLKLTEHLGPSSHVHLPPKRGGDVYPCSWIGQDVCNLRATDALAHVLPVILPQDWIEKEKENSDERRQTEKQVEEEASLNEQLDEYDNLYDEPQEPKPVESAQAEDAILAAIAMGEHLHSLTEKCESQRIAEAFDTAFDFLDELYDWDNWEDDKEGRKKKASKLKQLGKAANVALKRSTNFPCMSEYNDVIEHVIPRMIESHGKLVLRANEQGQESAGQMLKALLRNSANKRRKIGEYMRRKKNGTMTLCHFNKTATIGSTETLALKLNAYHTVESKLTTKLRGGHKVAEMKREGKQTKRERVMIEPLLDIPK